VLVLMLASVLQWRWQDRAVGEGEIESDKVGRQRWPTKVIRLLNKTQKRETETRGQTSAWQAYESSNGWVKT
jgi:hypothetical protein